MKLNLIYGWHVVNHVLLNNYKLIFKLFLFNKHKKFSYLLKIFNKYDINYFLVNLSFFNKFLSNKNHQGIYAEIYSVLYRSEFYLFDLIKNVKNPLLLIFDSVNDPQNLGICFRISSLIGVNVIIFPYNNSCVITDSVHKISCGASLTVPVIKVINIVRLLNMLKLRNIYVVGTSERAKLSIYSEHLNVPLAIVIGSEYSGLRYLTMKNCDSIVSIPIKGYNKSLNMAIATSVILFEVLRQRYKFS